MNLKEQVHSILDSDIHNSLVDRTINQFLIVLILLNSLCVILETVPSLYKAYGVYFRSFDTFSVAVFSIEYVFRVWTCTVDPKFGSPIIGRLKYMVTPFAIIDLLALVPFYLPMLIAFDIRFIRLFRVFRLIRLLKLGRYSEVIQRLGRVLIAKKEELIVTFGIVFLLLVIASSLMYYVEYPANRRFSLAFQLPCGGE